MCKLENSTILQDFVFHIEKANDLCYNGPIIYEFGCAKLYLVAIATV